MIPYHTEQAKIKQPLSGGVHMWSMYDIIAKEKQSLCAHQTAYIKAAAWGL